MQKRHAVAIRQKGHAPARAQGAALPAPPVRTCVGCRQLDSQRNLRRAVADPAGRLLVQAGRRPLPGRGAYVHPREKCLIAAVSRGGFDRSFRRKLQVLETAALLSTLATLDSARCAVDPAASKEDQE